MEEDLHGTESQTKAELETRLNARLQAIHARLQWISDAEARAAWVNSLAARSVFEQERDRLIEEAERALDALEALGGTLKYQPI